jgi:hypothetical protein
MKYDEGVKEKLEIKGGHFGIFFIFFFLRKEENE